MKANGVIHRGALGYNDSMEQTSQDMHGLENPFFDEFFDGDAGVETGYRN